MSAAEGRPKAAARPGALPPAGPAAPIGVFDSGLGGLTAVRELRRILPGEDIVYFGDTGRVPYGTKGERIICAYARQDIAFLLSKGVKTVLAACGTVSSTFPDEEGQRLPIGYAGVVKAAAAAAAAATRSGRVGIIGTEATIASGSYQRALAALLPGAQALTAACPLFVPLVESGHFAPGDALVALAAEEYLAQVRAAGVDTLILGCTHYPLLAASIAAYMGGGVALIDPGREAALALAGSLARQGLLREEGGHSGALTCYVSDEPSRFSRLAGSFLGRAEAPLSAERVNIESYRLDWILKGWMPGVE